MPNELSQNGIGIIGLQDVHNSTVNVTQILGKSAEYKDLLNQLETQRELFAYLPEDQTEKRLRISQTIAQLEAQIEQFKQDVTKLAQEFNRIEINTDRLRRAKEHFEQGEIAAARAVFDSEREQMQNENDRLVREKPRIEQFLQMLKHNSEEFYMRALLERTAYDNPNWLADTCEYFERSIKAMETEGNVFQYALFLQEHNHFAQAEPWYQKYLDKFASDDQFKRAMALNNLANLHSNKKELAAAEAEYGEALDIRRKLAEVNPSEYLPDVAITLNNLAVLHSDKKELAAAEAEYREALELYRKLAEENPSAYLRDVGLTLNNLAAMHSNNYQLAAAEAEYREALELYRKLAEADPSEYLPDVALTLINIAIYYLQSRPDRERSIDLAIESLTILRPFVNSALYTQRYMQSAIWVLQKWGISMEDIQSRLESRGE
ncbi:MAG: tetratricopeptide repeat protein [Blastocatellia bacterium]|nr:tetratricopeptide repeat protein [Blastocatellia bacterium]